MRKVVFYLGGVVADFSIADDRFDVFAGTMPWERRHSRDDLDKARQALAAFVRRGAGDPETKVGPNETLAACFIWNYFNTNPEGDKQIDGDVLVVDLHGDGMSIDYMAVADADLAREN